METENKIIDLLKEDDLDILECIEILRNIESAFLEQLNINFATQRKNIKNSNKRL